MGHAMVGVAYWVKKSRSLPPADSNYRPYQLSLFLLVFVTLCEHAPAYRGGSFLLHREQRHRLRRVAASYTLSAGVDFRATHGIRYALCQADIRLASSRMFIAAFLSLLW